ncbi:hypothetical protein YC2023_030280 [Brassica napus]
MAISHVRPLLLPLLVSLFFLPAALNATRFSKCDPRHSYPIAASGVLFSPDDAWIKTSTNANITLSAQTYTSISDGATVTFSIWGYISDDRNYPLCDLVACPVAPGPLVFTLPNVFTEEELTRVKRYYTYSATLKITVENQEDPMMCIHFDCFVTAETVPA